MTFLEKAKNDLKYEEFSGDGLPCKCPCKYGYEKEYSCSGVECEDCWNREMPNTEPKADKSFTVQSAYRKGKKDAWELANKIYTMSDKEFDDVFGYVHKEDIFCYLNYDEALAKLKAYEEAQIKVGDVVAWTDFADDTFNGVVLDFKDNTDNEVVVFNENGCVDVWKIADCKKTGKHIDIQSILEQIGE